jgi:hypothetical protein
MHCVCCRWPRRGEPIISAVTVFVGCVDGVHALDLTRGTARLYELKSSAAAGQTPPCITGLTVTSNGARLFALRQTSLWTIDLGTGRFRLSGQSKDPWLSGLLIDPLTQSLLLCDQLSNCIRRVCGVNV